MEKLNLSEMLVMMLSGQPLPRSEAFNKLCSEVVRRKEQQKGEEENVELWAEQLSKDLSQFTD